MAEKFPADRFDQVPDDLERVGAHRAPRPRGYGWVWVAWCAGAVVVIVGIGALGIFAINGTLNVDLPFQHSASATPTPTSTPTPTITPAVNPALNLMVLNGTDTAGLAADATTTLKAAGWEKITPANASSTDVKTTTVYYSDTKNLAAAMAVSKELADAPLQETQDFAASGADITVVIGADYKPTHQ
ncbi:LytR C-terminal domain-containing protein [Humibacter ginsenosidimutans]|uniref:LytR family transcriptional regulator n=1 Tax=Humibacter ginsenosidimutans TaxID=2599293 RepID=A0A5B8M1X2_9MICO|nr:LytR C-terminal domain-containing protein [Humibacter ginsenosidimutans]QDZ14748.1 LytR family transcriptional regulator [Humibacter ginsenosidimutans]